MPPSGADAALDLDLHRRLSRANRDRLAPTLPADLDEGAPGSSTELDLALEERFLVQERAKVSAAAAATPRDAAGFVAWFESLADRGPGQNDPLFPWLAEEASREDLRWFLAQEVAGEAGFEDLLALTQVKFPDQAKLELARNFWDEMGRGHARGMHGPMLARLAAALDVAPPEDAIVVESLALGNLMIALAARRPYAYHSIGALGVIELTAPGRSACVNRGLARVGLDAGARQYFALHATLDRQHSAAWNREVLTSLAASRPAATRAMAEGALMRLTAGARCFARYRRELSFQPVSGGAGTPARSTA